MNHLIGEEHTGFFAGVNRTYSQAMRVCALNFEDGGVREIGGRYAKALRKLVHELRMTFREITYN